MNALKVSLVETLFIDMCSTVITCDYPEMSWKNSAFIEVLPDRGPLKLT